MEVAVIGGGVAGLGSALALARLGHSVTVFERDDTPTPATADEAFLWDRRGAPQVRHSHAFLARLRNLLRDHYPDILQSLLTEGATEMRFGDDLPATITNFERLPEDDDLVMLSCRRTTFEWVLRRAALAHGNVKMHTGHGVVGFTHTPGAVPRVTGIKLDDGSTHDADYVIAAGGRRSAVPEWLTDIGCAPVNESSEDTGIVYFSRFYRLKPGMQYPPRTGPIGGDLGYLKYGVFVGDNRTFSVTLATPVADEQLRKLCSDPVVFDNIARTLVATSTWLDGCAEPITPDVHVMAGLLNRWREYVVDNKPVVLGMHVVGDAHLCTNPLYGRGCTTSFLHAHLMAQAVAHHPDDVAAQATELHESTQRELYPWYKSTVEQDTEARRVANAILDDQDPDSDTTDPRTMMRAVFRDGLLPAMRTDAVVMRAFFRTFNLLTLPDALMKDADIGARIFAVWNDRDNRAPEPALGPSTRAELLQCIPA